MRTVERVSALKPPERARKAAERDARRAAKSMTRDRDILIGVQTYELSRKQE